MNSPITIDKNSSIRLGLVAVVVAVAFWGGNLSSQVSAESRTNEQQAEVISRLVRITEQTAAVARMNAELIQELYQRP